METKHAKQKDYSGDNLWIREVWTDATQGCGCGESEIYETMYAKVGDLYKSLQKEYGKCISKTYIDTDDGTVSVGWVFSKAMQYEDTKDKYIMETWVEVFEKPPVIETTYFYKEIK